MFRLIRHRKSNTTTKSERMASAAILIKQEPGAEIDIEERIVALCQLHPEGIDTEDLKADPLLSQFSIAQFVPALNALAKARRLIFKMKKGKPVYCLPEPSSVKGDDLQEKLVHQIISEAGNKGVWIRDIRTRTNLPMTQLNKVLKTMESKKLIKAVKPVAASKKKIYMLFDLEPDSSVTGGAWYNDNKFDVEFSDVLNKYCCAFLEQKAIKAKEQHTDLIVQQRAALATAEEVLSYITKLGISTIELTVNDIRDVLNTLIYDGKVKEITRVGVSGSKEDGQKVYRLQRPLISPSGLMRIPCGVCPVINQCHDEGAVTPVTCVYLKEWLERLTF